MAMLIEVTDSQEEVLNELWASSSDSKQEKFPTLESFIQGKVQAICAAAKQQVHDKMVRDFSKFVRSAMVRRVSKKSIVTTGYAYELEAAEIARITGFSLSEVCPPVAAGPHMGQEEQVDNA